MSSVRPGVAIVILSVASTLYGAGDRQARTRNGPKVHLVAVRDSRLLTMCFPTGATDASPARGKRREPPTDPVRTQSMSEDRLLLTLPDVNASVILPIPASGQRTAVWTELGVGRIAEDRALKARVETALLERKEFDLVASPIEADIVLLVEGIYTPTRTIGVYEVGTKGVTARSESIAVHGDWDATFLGAVLAIAVPASIYRDRTSQLSSLLAARTWEGSATMQRPSTRSPAGLQPASPESVISQFHGNEKRPANHPPLCAASVDGPAVPLLPSGVKRSDASSLPTVALAKAGPATSAEATRSSTSRATFNADVTVVSVPVSVTDEAGGFVGDLQARDFRVFEDEVEQRIDRVMSVSEPYTAVVLVDVSSSMRLETSQIQQALQWFVETTRADARVMVVTFDERVLLYAEPSSDRSLLTSAIGRIGRGDGTRLHDALEVVTTERLDAIDSPKAIVLVTDGLDTRSRLIDAARSLTRAGESQAPIHVVQYDPSDRNLPVTMPMLTMTLAPMVIPARTLGDGSVFARAADHLASLGEASGGVAYRATSEARLRSTLAHIAQELNHQYTLAYSPANTALDGTYRRIRVEIGRAGVTVRTRAGYRPWPRAAGTVGTLGPASINSFKIERQPGRPASGSLLWSGRVRRH